MSASSRSYKLNRALGGRFSSGRRNAQLTLNRIMNDKICLVTGANSGIGKVTAKVLAAGGATVIMVSRNRDKGEAARDEIVGKTRNENVELMIADLSDPRQIRRLAAEVKAKYSRLHTLVNNA